MSALTEVEIRAITPEDPEWPAALADLADPPAQLWLRGSGNLTELMARAVTVTGARDATTYGCEVAADFGADLADAGYTIMSGGAYGIDASVLRGALAMGKPGVVVMAGGVDVDYPRAHSALFVRLAVDGLIVSEFEPGTMPTKSGFLARARLMAALSQALVVVEASRRSGSLRAMWAAYHLGRMVLAVPGPVTSQQSAGTNGAIRAGLARLAATALDVRESLGEDREAV